jgi:hypothetical protein
MGRIPRYAVVADTGATLTVQALATTLNGRCGFFAPGPIGLLIITEKQDLTQASPN